MKYELVEFGSGMCGIRRPVYKKVVRSPSDPGKYREGEGLYRYLSMVHLIDMWDSENEIDDFGPYMADKAVAAKRFEALRRTDIASKEITVLDTFDTEG